MKRILTAVAIIALISMLTVVGSASPDEISVPRAHGGTPTVDGSVSSEEYAGVQAGYVTFPTKGGETCEVFFVHGLFTLYVGFIVPNTDTDSGVQVFLDPEYNKGTAPQTDDWRFTISLRDYPNDYGENQGNGVDWGSWLPPDGWDGDHQVGDGNWTAEFAIPAKKLGSATGVFKKMGIAFCNCWTSSDHYWPGDADWMNPESWGTAIFLQYVGGVAVAIDKIGLLAPYIGLVSTIVIATVATTIYVKRRKEN